jgi:putative peptidoglycan lipid II flippase
MIALGVNAGLGAILMFPLQHGGLALATSLSAGVNFLLLILFLRRKLGKIGARKVTVSFLKNLGASAILGIVSYGVISLGSWKMSGMTVTKMFLLLGAIGAGLGAYAGVCKIWGCEELAMILQIIRRKIRR